MDTKKDDPCTIQRSPFPITLGHFKISFTKGKLQEFSLTQVKEDAVLSE